MIRAKQRVNTTRALAATVTVGAIAVLLVGCAPAALPVHAEVEWEGQNTGEFEDDPRVQAVREYVVQAYAADNALNYSDPALTEVATNTNLSLRAGRAASSIHYSPDYSAPLWEGPPSFTVTDVVKLPRPDQAFEVDVCAMVAPRWTLVVDDSFEQGKLQERDGAYRIEQEHFVEYWYTVWKSGDRWRVEVEGDLRQKCEPADDFAVGTYTTPPVIDLLHEATPDMVRGPDGERVDDSLLSRIPPDLPEW